MGWTSYSRWSSPRTREEERAEIVRLHTTLIDTAPYTAECLMASKVGSTWYAAIRLTPKPGREIAGPVMSGCVPDERGAITYAGVVLTDRRDGKWGYKSLCESMGPTQAEAPLKLLSLLSPLDPETDRYAQSWRDRVAAHHAARRGRVKIAPGDRFEIERPFTFGGRGGGTFEARRFEAFRAEHPGRRPTTLYRTLDTPTPQVVKIPLRALHAAGPRLLEAETAPD